MHNVCRRDQKMKKRELVNTRQESLFDSRDPVTSNICLVLLTESLLRFAFSCRELGPRRCVALPSSLHRFFQLLQTRWTQRLFTIRCLKIWARLPSCILRYLPTHAATRSHARTHNNNNTERGVAHAPARHFFGTGLRNSSRRPVATHVRTHLHTYCSFFNPHKVGPCVCPVWWIALAPTPPPFLTHTHSDQCRVNVRSERSGGGKGAKKQLRSSEKNTFRCQSRYAGAINGTKSYQISTPVYL